MSSSFTVEAPDLGPSRSHKSIVHATIRTEDRIWRLPVWICRDHPDKPSLLLIGGQHGDEYQGCAILLEFLRTAWANLRGNLIVLPEVNPPALDAGTRTSPLDRGNLNRAFPGCRDGTITEAIAHFVASAILPMVDQVLDIHSGGKGMDIVPSVMTHYLDTPPALRSTLAAMRATDLPVSIVVDETHKDGMLDTLVERQGKLFLCAELGGGHLRARDITLGLRMVRNFVARGNPDAAGLHESGALKVLPRLLEVPDGDYYLKASAAGLFAPAVAAGDPIERGQPLGRLYPAQGEPLAASVVIDAPADGVAYMVRVSGRVAAGDDLVVLAIPGRPEFVSMWQD